MITLLHLFNILYILLHLPHKKHLIQFRLPLQLHQLVFDRDLLVGGPILRRMQLRQLEVVAEANEILRFIRKSGYTTGYARLLIILILIIPGFHFVRLGAQMYLRTDVAVVIRIFVVVVVYWFYD